MSRPKEPSIEEILLGIQRREEDRNRCASEEPVASTCQQRLDPRAPSQPEDSGLRSSQLARRVERSLKRIGVLVDRTRAALSAPASLAPSTVASPRPKDRPSPELAPPGASTSPVPAPAFPVGPSWFDAVLQGSPSW